MSEDPENFDSLRRLLALKRYEQPPPGYFRDFSGQVIARIKLGGPESRWFDLEGLLLDAPWLQRILGAFEAKPVLAGVFGVAVCGLLISGVVYSDRTDVPPVALIPVAAGASQPGEIAKVSAADHPLLAKPAMLEAASSTSPVGAGVDPFSSGQLRAQPVSFTFPGQN
jgi:hypothetical protein